MGGPRLPESSDRIIWSPVINRPNSTCCVGSINSRSVKWKTICGCEFWSQMEHFGWSAWCFFAGLSTILSAVCGCAWVYTMNWPIKKVIKSMNAANLFNEISFTLKSLRLNPFIRWVILLIWSKIRKIKYKAIVLHLLLLWHCINVRLKDKLNLQKSPQKWMLFLRAVYGADQAVYFLEGINLPSISYWLASKPWTSCSLTIRYSESL